MSTATLFKRFPTKAALFEAIVEQFWEVAQICDGPPVTGDPARGLRKVGLGYARRMRQPEMAAIYRLIIAEALRFPDLGQMLHDKGKAPLLAGLESYLAAEVQAGTLVITDAELPKVSRAFFAVIAGQVFWPELVVPGCGGSEEQMTSIVEDAIELIIARYGRR